MIVQDAYDIPADIATKLATGEYRRIGSVIRYAIGPNKGQIVKHLKPVQLKAAEQAKGIGAKALEFFNQHKKGVLIGAAGAALIGGGAWVYSKMRNQEPKVVTEFHAALRAYIEAIRNGKMDISTIEAVMEALQKVKAHKNYEKISIQLTTDELEVLVSRIHDYTIKLAMDNAVDLTESDLTSCNNSKRDAIIDLQTYLQVQKKIFEKAA